jgi:hypothetical protein
MARLGVPVDGRVRKLRAVEDQSVSVPEEITGKPGRGVARQLAWSPCSQSPDDERNGMTPVLLPCSRSAHDQNVLARRPQWDQHGCHSTNEKQASLEGRDGYPGRPPARGTRTIRMCSFDARNRGSTKLPCKERTRRAWRDHYRNVVVRWAQWRPHQPPRWIRVKSREIARSTRSVGDHARLFLSERED